MYRSKGSAKGYWTSDMKHYYLVPDVAPNKDHILTINNNKLNGADVEWHLVDPRKARPKQRALFWALMGDIAQWNGYEPDDMRYYFYNRFMVAHEGKEISLADTTMNTVTDAKELIDDVIDYIFEFRVPVKAGYELLPRNEEHYQYQCLRHRMCVICGQHADIHHIDEIGMGRDRTKLDHTKFHLMALCPAHHTEFHKIGPTAFGNKYHLNMTGIKADKETLKQIGVKGNYGTTS